MNNSEFNLSVINVTTFLANVIQFMPGPKHPAKRLYELSEKIRRFHKIIDKNHRPILSGRQK